MKRGAWVLGALAVLACGLTAAPAGAKTASRPLRCRHGYVRKHVRVNTRRHGRKVKVWTYRCERAPKRKTATLPAKVSYKAAVDPAFTQSATNPLAVTYAYSATAIATLGSTVTNLAATGQLPAGVLNFYSPSTPGGPKQLYCSMNVGAAILGGNCPITYSSTGTYDVTTEYIPNAASAVTETDTETISPFSTTTTLTATQGACGSGSPPGYSASGPYCTYTLTTGAVDQNSNTVGPQVMVSAAPNTGQPAQPARLPTNASCTVYVTANWVLTPNPPNQACGSYNLGSGLITAASWTITASFPGSNGWSASTATPVTLTP